MQYRRPNTKGALTGDLSMQFHEKYEDNVPL
jgi:hypothetical protein